MRIIYLISVLAIAVACGSSKKSVKESASGSNPAPHVITGDSIFLSFERTLCFGECPAFRVTVYPDGSAKYEGKKFVERTGTYTAKVTPEQVADINREAGRIRFFELQDKYDASVSDVPSVITVISGPSGLKKVVNRFNGPEELKSFEKYLDSVLLSLDWKKKE